jgi:hypothetical protein
MELSWLRNRAAHWNLLLLTSEGNDPVCSHCLESRVATVANPLCAHAACAACWTRHVESHLNERSCADDLGQISCLAANCNRCIPWSVVRGICAGYSALVASHASKTDKQFRNNQMRIVLNQVPRSVEGRFLSMCSICREYCHVLLANTPCDHAVCGSCWKLWTESQLPRSFANRWDTVRCFSPQCQHAICTPLWDHLVSVSNAIHDFDQIPDLQRRRRLRMNALYPESFQVDCPDPTCWGIGYLGFDTVMCFICERQWIPEEPGSSTDDFDVQEMMGVRVKQCPSCHESIEKNGGCDHMTCRCKYEFYWSTLKPYRTS